MRLNKNKIYKGKRVKGLKVKTNKIGRVKSMDRTVSTKTLFTSNEDYSKLDNVQRRSYINQLSKEFICSARDLLESLKDK